MNKLIGFGAVLALVAACDQRPAGDDTVEPPTQEPVGEEPVVGTRQVTVGDLNSALYNPDATNPLRVRVSLDGGVQQLQVYGVYVDGRIAGLPYESYSFQDGGDSRFFRAFAAESSDGSVNAAVVSDGGQFNRFFGGAVANQENYSAPSGGLGRYRGDYVGLVNFGDPAGEGPEGAGSGVPTESYAITGDVFILADFTEGAVNGEIFNREFEAAAAGYLPTGAEGDYELPNIVLVVGDIASNGSFTGGAEITVDGQFVNVGSYGGLFGGTNATSVAGLTRFGTGFLGVAEIASPTAPGGVILVPLGNGNEIEHGIFVLDSTGPFTAD